MISNMIEVVGEGDDRDLDLLDGYEDLSQEHQDKLARALDQGHIDDEDWNGVSGVLFSCATHSRYSELLPRPMDGILINMV
jgi:hypothetical protein